MLLTAVIIVVALIWWCARPFYWKGKGIKYLLPWPVVGNFGGVFTEGVLSMQRSLYNTFPEEKLFGFHSFLRPGLLIRDPELMVEITVSNFDHFTENALGSNQEYDMTGGNLLFLKGQQWKEVRSKVSPFFTPAKVKSMISSSVEITMPKAEKKLDELINTGQPCNHSQLLAQIVNDIITQSVFGMESDAFEENSLFLPMAEVFFSPKTNFMFTLRNASQTIFKLLRLQAFDTDGALFVKKIVKDLMEHRITHEGVEGHDFVQGMIEVMKKHGKEGQSGKIEYYPDGTRVPKYDFNEMFMHAFIIFLGGIESTATLMTWLFYELAQNQDIQDKCRAEVVSISEEKGRQILIEDVNELTYTMATVREAVRLYPPFPVLTRICEKPYKLKNYDITVQPGQMIFYPLEAIQRDPKNFSEPNTFNPDRFLDGESLQNGVISTFGLGPRFCLGKSFAMTETVLVVSRLIHKYRFSLHNKTKIPLVTNKRRPINSPSTPLWVEVTRA